MYTCAKHTNRETWSLQAAVSTINNDSKVDNNTARRCLPVMAELCILKDMFLTTGNEVVTGKPQRDVFLCTAVYDE